MKAVKDKREQQIPSYTHQENPKQNTEAFEKLEGESRV